jgi:hypothetical protein
MLKKIVCATVIYLWMSAGAHAEPVKKPLSNRAGVLIRIRVVNPLNKETSAPIKYPLPKEIKPEDIIGKRIVYSFGRELGKPGSEEAKVEPKVEETETESKAHETEAQKAKTGELDQDFKISFDKKKRYYYVDHELVLGPKEFVLLELRVRDVWVIGEESIESLRQDLNNLLMGSSADLGETAKALKEEIFNELGEVMRKQAQNTVYLAGVEEHIEVYRKNMDTLRQAELDIEMLKNLIVEGE